MFLTLYVAFILTAVFSGLAGGWWLRNRGVRPAEAPLDNDEVRRARELLGSLQKMASTVAVEVGEHSTRVEEINVELKSNKLHEPTKILSVVSKLVDVNKSMQGRLDQAEDKLREQVRLVESHTAEARIDALTLVGNRRAFETDIAQYLADFRGSGRVFSLAMIDLDKFKRLNDTYGHQAGDEVLRGTGRVLRHVLRESDSISRYGGEEFVILFNRSSIADVRRALTRLRKAIAEAEFQGPSGKLAVTVSIGATQAEGEESLESIVQRADAALYASKEAGRNCCHWHDGQKILLVADEQPKPPAPPETPAAAEVTKSEKVKVADDLPDLLNRTAFCQHVRTRVAEWKRGGPAFSLVLVEIDFFDGLTRTYGAKLRDLLVTSLARVVFAGVREMDMVARYSPSCLGFLLPNAQLADAVRVADRIREAAGQVAINLSGTRLGYSVSVGLVEVGSADDMVTLLRNAEIALDAGHLRGGNCLFHHDGQRCLMAVPEHALGV